MTDKLPLHSPDIVSENIERIAALFPNCITETANGKAIDFDQLRQELNQDIVEGTKEPYRLEWPGERETIVKANLPTTTKKIAIEIAIQGIEGYRLGKKDYIIPSIPNQLFSGCKILSYYYVSWAVAMPGEVHKLGLEYGKEYEMPVKMIN